MAEEWPSAVDDNSTTEHDLFDIEVVRQIKDNHFDIGSANIRDSRGNFGGRATASLQRICVPVRMFRQVLQNLFALQRRGQCESESIDGIYAGSGVAVP